MSNSTCTTDGCTNPVHVKKHGLCQHHYKQVRLQWMPECGAEGCTRKVLAKGLCNAHYQRTRKRPDTITSVAWQGAPGLRQVEGEWVKPCEGCSDHFAVTYRTFRTKKLCDACSRTRQNAAIAAWRKRPERRQVERVRRRDRDNRRRAIVVEAADLVPATTLLLQMANYCQACGVALTGHDGPNAKHVDHVVPLAAGGAHASTNLRVICRTCNVSRPSDGSDLPSEALQRHPVLLGENPMSPR